MGGGRLAASTSGVTVEGTGTGPGQPAPGRTTGWAGLLLLVASAVGLLAQGAYYGTAQWLVGLLVAAAAAITLVAWPPTRDDARLLPVVPASALAAWALLDTVKLGHPAGGAGGYVLSLLGLVAVLLTCRRLGQEDRDVLLIGVAGTGLVVALAGWLGVVGRLGSLAWEGDGIWRASATLSYPNAAAAVLVPVALVVLARLVQEPRSVPLALVATGLLAGAAATASRAGAVALVVGLVVIAGLQGPRPTIRAAVGPAAGGLIVLAGLVPSMPATAQPRPAVAVAGLAAGLAVAVLVARAQPARAAALVVAVTVAGGLTLAALGGGGEAYRAVAGARATLASPERSDALRAALAVAADHPLGGAGPGQTELRWEGPDGVVRFFRYAHNEYVQVAAELGLVGLGLLAALLVALARMLWRARPARPGGQVWAGVVAAAAAFAVHSGFDFVWHLPAVLLTVTLLAGVVLPPIPPRKERS